MHWPARAGRAARKRTAAIGSLCVLAWIVLASCSDDSTTQPTPPENRPPIIAEQPDTSADLGGSLILRTLATDADGDSISYILKVFLTMEEFRQGYAPDARLVNKTRTFTYRPSSRDVPGRTFEFIADDGNEGRDTTQFFVSVGQ